jgi:hypothetical protein
MYKTYRAVETRDGGWVSNITSVGAEDIGQGFERIKHELGKNPSRRWYLNKWQAQGHPMVIESDYSKIFYVKEKE